jgi:hypothetical protein
MPWRRAEPRQARSPSQRRRAGQGRASSNPSTGHDESRVRLACVASRHRKGCADRRRLSQSQGRLRVQGGYGGLGAFIMVRCASACPWPGGANAHELVASRGGWPLSRHWRDLAESRCLAGKPLVPVVAARTIRSDRAAHGGCGGRTGRQAREPLGRRGRNGAIPIGTHTGTRALYSARELAG